MRVAKSVNLFTEKYLENIGRMFNSLFRDETLTDVTLRCKDGSIKAHKLILAASSPYFRKIFVENNQDHAIFILHGISYGQLQNLIELIYKGSVNIHGEALDSLYDLAEEFEVTSFLNDDYTIATGAEIRERPNENSGRDTRYKGQKRVAVDYREIEEDEIFPKAKVVKPYPERRFSSSLPERCGVKKIETPFLLDREIKAAPPDDTESGDGNDKLSDSNPDGEKVDREPTETSTSEEDPNASSWAKKQRKFKCELCPSSFKRASHLSRHQLVHTGERPFACDQCDKAFSRHDKLKHHIRKAHEIGDQDSSGDIPAEALYTIGHIRVLTPESFNLDNPAPPPQKKGRGRPRKYPPVPPPLVKRPRGRPRLNPVALPPQPQPKVENYDITNLPFGDIEYLTKPLHDHGVGLEDPVMMEPLVEIKTEPAEKNETETEPSPPELLPEGLPESREPEPKCSNTFLGGIGLFENTVAKIGECTISVANHSAL